MGLQYSNLADSVGISPTHSITKTGISGLLPDLNYTTIQAIEDCPFSRTEPATDTLKAVFVPQDYTLFNLKSPNDSVSTLLPQRLFILIVGSGMLGSGVTARITLTQNWEGIPTRNFADLLSVNYSDSQNGYDGKDIYEYIIANNLVISKGDKDFGSYQFLEQFKRY